jgi:hypothetical protein
MIEYGRLATLCSGKNVTDVFGDDPAEAAPGTASASPTSVARINRLTIRSPLGVVEGNLSLWRLVR